jgi:hypothetical protein
MGPKGCPGGEKYFIMVQGKNKKTGLKILLFFYLNYIFDVESLCWCGRRDLNPYRLPHRILSPARLPVPPRPPADHNIAYSGLIFNKLNLETTFTSTLVRLLFLW